MQNEQNSLLSVPAVNQKKEREKVSVKMTLLAVIA